MYVSVIDLAERFGVSKSAIWGWSKSDPTFPKPLKLSRACTRWNLAEIEAWELSHKVANRQTA